MKKTVSLFMILLFCVGTLFLFGCENTIGELDADHKYAKERAEQVMTVFLSRDKEALKGMFSKGAIAEAEKLTGAETFDKQIEALFEFVEENEITHWEFNKNIASFSHSPSFALGPTEKSIVFKCDIITANGEYRLFFTDYMINKDLPDMVGLYSLWLIPKDYTSNGIVSESKPGIELTLDESSH